MLRIPFRRQFAPNQSPEREARETHFAVPNRREHESFDAGMPEGSQGSGAVEGGQSASAKRINATILPTKVSEVSKGRSVWYALQELEIGQAEDLAIRQLLSRQGIDLAPRADLWECVREWEKRNQELSEDIRGEIVSAFLKKPENEIRVIRQMERSRDRFEEILQYFDSHDGAEGKKKKNLLQSWDAYEKIEWLEQQMGMHGDTLEKWIKTVDAAELKRLLSIDLDSGSNREDIVRTAYNVRSHGTNMQLKVVSEAGDSFAKRRTQYGNKLSHGLSVLKSDVTLKLRDEANRTRNILNTRSSEVMRRIGRAPGDSPREKNDALKASDGVTAEALEDAVNERLNTTYAADPDRAEQEIRGSGMTVADQNARIRMLRTSTLPNPEHPAFTDHAEGLLRSLRETSALTEQDILAEAQAKQQGVDMWAFGIAPQLSAVCEMAQDSALRSRLVRDIGADGETYLQELTRLHDEHLVHYLGADGDIARVPSARRMEYGDLSRNAFQRIADTIVRIRRGQPRAFAALQRDIPAVVTAREELPEQIATARKRLNETTRFLKQQTRYQLTSAIGIDAQLATLDASMLRDFTRTEQQLAASTENDTAVRGTLARGFVNLERLERIAERLKGVSISLDLPPSDQRQGCFDQETRRIRINSSRCPTPESKELTVNHEMGHLMLHLFVRDPETAVFPGLLETRKQQHFEHPETGSRFRELLKQCGEAWGLAPQHQRELDRLRTEHVGDPKLFEMTGIENDKYHEDLLDELYNQYATMRDKASRDPAYDITSDHEYNPTVRELFGMIDRRDEPTKESIESNILTLPSTGADEYFGANRELARTGDLFNANAAIAPAESGEGEQQDPNKKSVNLWAQFATNKGMLYKMDSFIKSYPAFAEQLKPDYDNALIMHTRLLKMFNTKKFDTGSMESFEPEEHEGYKQAVEDYSEKLKDYVDALKKFQLKDREISAAPTGVKGLIKMFWEDVGWMSIADLGVMVKENVEDLKRMWKRRGETVRSKWGAGITGWIPDGIPYLGRLKFENDRRLQSSELEEVGVWEKALDNKDAWELQEIIKNTGSADQLKAILNLLTKRGRLDWSDQNLWRSLNNISNYSMPIDSCSHDEVLRDSWLRKLIADIWGDKDLFNGWKTANDGGVDSGKKKFTTTADDFSNIKGGMASEMERQLRLYKEAKASNSSVPEDVNPHLYEELLHYAMRNGKMTMEDKCFYLVQGVDAGLLSLDRLRFLAGEGGGILNRFPFIDYFYGHNNSNGEIKALAARLRETDSGPASYAPGPKTTFWFHLEVLRDENVRQRISKAISGERFQNIDHEDVPALMSQANFGQVEDFTGQISGDRLKLSNEGMKNGYVGTTTRMGILALHARLAKEGNAHFGTMECKEAARAIIAHLHYDNIMTRNGWDGKVRAKIEWDEMNKPGPSTNNKTVQQVRLGAAGFLTDIFNDLDAKGEINWSNTGISKDQYLAMQNPKQQGLNRPKAKPDELQTRIFEASAKLAPQLEQALINNKEALMDYLIKYHEEFTIDGGNTLTLEEGRRHYDTFTRI